MNKGDYLSAILKSPKTVFTVRDVALLWREDDTNKLTTRLTYYVNHGDLVRIRRGLYAKDAQYNPLELANRIYTPAYVSFETVLANEGIIFQYHSSIMSASYLTRSVKIDDQVYKFIKIHNDILTNNLGVYVKDEVSIASAERAVLDILYANKNYHFDNLGSIDWDQIDTILPIYNNKRMIKVVNKLHYQHDEA